VPEALAHTMRAGLNGRMVLTPDGSIG
jgi:hypothetical protein